MDVDELAAAVDAIAERTVDAGHGPRGAVLLVDLPGHARVAGAAGIARADTGEAMTRSHRFHVASVGKVITATLVLQLAEAGAFGDAGVDAPLGELDAVIGHLLPMSVIDRLVVVDGRPVGRSITVRQLLTHTSGMLDQITDGATGTERDLGRPAPDSLMTQWWRSVAGRTDDGLARHRWVPWDPARPDDERAGLLNRYVALDLGRSCVGRPGERFHYSDTGFVLLGLIVEAAGGAPYHEQQRRQILDPAGATSTYLAYRDDPSPEARASEADVWVNGVPLLSSAVDLPFDWGGGGQVSTVDDLATVLRHILGGAAFAEPGTLADMTTMVTPPHLTAPRVGLGLGLHTYRLANGHDVVGHAGAWGVRCFLHRETGAVVVGSVGQRDDCPWLSELVTLAIEAA